MDRDLTILVLMCYYERPNMATVALRSVLDQTYENWRLAVVDDGSARPIAPIVDKILAPVIDKVTVYSTGDSAEQKNAQGGSRFGSFWNRAVQETPADVAIMLCDDDALLPDYLENLNAWFRQNTGEVYCHSHVRVFDPFELTDLEDIGPTEHWLNRTGRIRPSNQVDASQVAWRTSCQLEGGVWFPSPLTVSLDAAFFAGMHAKYGDCPFSGFEGQYKGLHGSQLSNRGDTYGRVADLDRPYGPSRTVQLFKVNMSPEAPQRVAAVFESGYIGQGPVVEEFERRFQELVQTEVRPLFVNSGTSAITLALDLAGVGHGDEVVTTPMTCLATNLPILHRGARPVWADVDPVTGLIDPGDAVSKVTPKTKAIVAVDWAGRSCDYRALRQAGVPVVQDAAHRLYPSEEGGDYVCWSFQAIKFLTTGDGGALLVPERQYEQARLMRWFGLDRTSSTSFRCDQDVQYAGYKFQPNDIGAAIGLCNLDLAVEAVKNAQTNAQLYMEELAGMKNVVLPPWDDGCDWWLFTLLVEDGLQQAFIDFLAERQVVASRVHARNDLQRAFSGSVRGALPGVVSFSSREVAVPVGSWLGERDKRRVVEAVREYDSSLASRRA
jgi:dTDP-4-amino-4,6-dideoxygalactose transaminase